MTEFVAGWVGGCSGLLLGHPFDTLKVRQQALNHKSIIFTVQDCVKQDGLKSLMRGLSYPVYTVGAINAIFFGVYTRTLDSLSTSSAMTSSRLLSVFTAGCVAGAAQLSLAVPVDLVKVRLQADQGRYRGPWDCLRSVFRQEGVRGCYRGLGIQGLRDVKASGIYFVIYHW